MFCTIITVSDETTVCITCRTWSTITNAIGGNIVRESDDVAVPRLSPSVAKS